MAGRSRWRNGVLIRCGLAAGVLLGGSVSSGADEIFWEGGQALQWRGGWGGPFVQPIQAAPSEQSQDGFTVSASGTAIQDTPAGEALKLIEAGQWVKAIQKIESLDDSAQGLVVDERGVLRPLSAMKSALIASMPPEGRRTFTKLNDPAANAKLADARQATDLTERAKAFKVLVDDYALCDAAAQAALKLGDIRFEQGRFNEAAAYYRFAADHPATTADDPALIARRLTALSRAEQWSAFDELAEYARFRHANTSVTIAGEDAPLKTFITQLVESRGEVTIDRPVDTPQTIAMPKTAELEYDRDLISENHFDLIRQLAANNNLAGIVDQTIAPVVVCDEDRLFALALGRVVRLDPETGTELWHHGSTAESVQGLQSRMHYLANGYHQSLTVHGDMLLASIPQKQNISQSHLIAIDAETGKQKWTTRDILRNNSEGIVGEPLVVDHRVFFVTARNGMEVKLRVAHINDGSELGSVALGKAAKDAHMNTPAELSPRLAMGQGHLMVQTNNGALIAVDVNTMKIAWAYSQKIRPSGVAMMRRHGYAVADAMCRHTGDVVAIDGAIIAKDTRTNQVVAMREHDAAMLWQAEVDPDATIVHLDNQRVYVLGKELVALDLRTGERVWWTPHPGEKAGKPIFTQNAALIAGSHRFCRIDLATGKLTHYREDLAQPAALHVVGDNIIRVTNEGLTALPLP